MDRKAKPGKAPKLGQQAENLLKEGPSALNGLSDEQIGEVLQELQAHQMELERQNRGLIETQEELMSHITTRKRAEQVLQQAHDELEKRVEERTTELAQANEELRAEIAERERTEHALRESEQRFRATFEQAAVGIGHTDLEGRWLRVNRKLCDILGYDYEELIQKTFYELIHPDELATDASSFQRLVTGETDTYSRDQRYLRKDNTTAWLRVSVSLARDHASGEPKYAISVVEDVTERKEAEAALFQRNRELRLLSQSALAFNSSLDLDETLTTVLEAVRYLLGVTACRVWLVGEPAGELVCRQVNKDSSTIERDQRIALGEGLAGWVAEHGQSLIVPDVRSDEHHFKEIDPETDHDIRSVLSIPLQVKRETIGVLQALDTTINRFTDANLKLLESLAATAAIALEHARLYRQAQQDAETKSTLLREINHRVKNNLSAIIGMLRRKQRNFAVQESAICRVIIEELITQVQGLATVHSLLSASGWAPLPLDKVAEQVIFSTLRALSAEARISINVASSAVAVTPEQANNLALVINELTTNTVKHALPETPDLAQINVQISRDDSQVQFQFQDNGLGYPAELLQFDQEYTSIGFELIQNIVRRNLRGELSLGNDEGATTIIQFEALV